MTPTDFIALMLPGALASQAATGVPAGFTIAQAAVESGWLKVTPPGNNLFGIKADASWTGPTVEEATHEYFGGVKRAETDPFRAYPDYTSSLIDHAKFLCGNPRYNNCLSTTNSVAFAKAVAAAGYATAPNYAEELTGIIQFHNLTQYDVLPTN